MIIAVCQKAVAAAGKRKRQLLPRTFRKELAKLTRRYAHVFEGKPTFKDVAVRYFRALLQAPSTLRTTVRPERYYRQPLVQDIPQALPDRDILCDVSQGLPRCHSVSRCLATTRSFTRKEEYPGSCPLSAKRPTQATS